MDLTADADLFGIKELAGENTTSSALFPRLTNEVLKLDMALQKTLVRFNGRGFEARGVKKLSRRSNPFENGIFLAQLVIISAEIAGQLTPSRSARSFESKLRPSQFTSEFAH